MVNTKENIFYTISEIAGEFKVDKRSIRFCEEKGLISPKVTKLNRRLYSEYDRARLELILHCEASGYSLDQVVELIGIPDPDLSKIEQFKKGLEYGENKLDELIKQGEKLSFHTRTSIMTDINILRNYVKNIQAIKTKILDEVEEKPPVSEEEKLELEKEIVQPEAEEKPLRQPFRMTPVWVTGIIFVLMIAGYVYYQKNTQETKSGDLAQMQKIKIESKSADQDSVPSGITEDQQDRQLEESKEQLDEGPLESQKETKIVLSKAYPNAMRNSVATKRGGDMRE